METMDRIDCPVHDRGMYYCDTCVKLVCRMCEDQHPHMTRELDEMDRQEFKTSIEKKSKGVKEIATKLSAQEKRLDELRSLKLYCLDKKSSTEIDTTLFSELGSVLSAIARTAEAINKGLNTCQTTLTPSLATATAEAQATTQLLATFDEDVKDANKIKELYWNRKPYNEAEGQGVETEIQKLLQNGQEYKEAVGRVMQILDKHWFEGIPGKLDNLKTMGQDIRKKVKSLEDLAQLQKAALSEHQANQMKVSAQAKNAEAEVRKCQELILAIKSKRLGEDVEALLRDLAVQKAKRDNLLQTNAELEQTKAKLSKEQGELNGMLQLLQRGLIDKAKEMEVYKQEISKCEAELNKRQNTLVDLNRQVDQLAQGSQTQIRRGQDKLAELRGNLAAIATTHEEWKSMVEDTDKALKEKKETLEKMKERVEAQKVRLKENSVTLTKQKLEIEDHFKSVSTELIKHQANARAITATLKAIQETKKGLENWLSFHTVRMSATLIALAAFKRATVKASNATAAKQEELNATTAKCEAAIAQLQELHKMYAHHNARVAKFAEKLQGQNERFAREVDTLDKKRKELDAHIDKAREDYMRDKCANCIRKTTHKLVLQCGHRLCPNCEETAMPAYTHAGEAFTMQCLICNQQSSQLCYPLRCGCAIELREFGTFKHRLKEDTDGAFAFYNSYELAIKPVCCLRGHEIHDDELASLYTEPLRFEESRAMLRMRLDEDRKSTKREEIIKTIMGKTEAKIFNTRLKLGNDGVRFLADALPVLKNVEKIDLDANLIGDEGIKFLARALIHTPPTLVVLDLRRNLVSDEGMKHLARALPLIRGLKEFYASSNKMTALSGKHLGEVLHSLAELKLLHLSQNELGASGCSCLAQALVDNTSLESLNLSNNKVLDEGAIAIGKALATNQVLKTLHLQSNMIGFDGLQGLIQGLEKNKALATIDLRFNKFGPPGEDACKRLEDTRNPHITITYY